jgi:hypothetical protein
MFMFAMQTYLCLFYQYGHKEYMILIRIKILTIFLYSILMIQSYNIHA